MNFSYILFLLTFLIFPLIALIISKQIKSKKQKQILLVTISSLIFYDILFTIGYSFRGDYADYVIFSLEYFILCILTFSIPPGRWFRNALLDIGRAGIIVGVIVGLIGIFMFIVISQDYESDKKLHFENYGRQYEVRRYVFGFATLSDTRYTFETYHVFKLLPIEYKVDKTNFFALKSPLFIASDSLVVSIVKDKQNEYLVFTSDNGSSFTKKLH